MTADAVSRAIERYRQTAPPRFHKGRNLTGSYREIGRIIGHDMGQRLLCITSEKDALVTTLADIAEATGCTLEIRLVPKAGEAEERPADGSQRAA